MSITSDSLPFGAAPNRRAIPTAADERRRRERISTSAPGWLIPNSDHGNTEPWEVRVNNISRLGVGFESSSRLVIGEIVRIRIGRGPMHLARRMRVVSCRPSPQGTYILGGEFIEDAPTSRKA